VSSEDKFDAEKYNRELHDQIHREVHDRIERDVAGRVKGRRPRKPGLFPGLVLMVVGTVILLEHIGIISSATLWTFWPAALIVLGLFKFMEQCNRVFGALLVLVGTLLLLHNLGLSRLSWGEIWPIALIAAGVMLIWSRFELPKLPKVTQGGTNVNVNTAANMINEYALFGAVERRININNFAGGTVAATFGGVELDFRSADIEGEEAVVMVEAIFGGIEVTVPDRWHVVWEGQSIFGGFGDETRPPLPEVPGAPSRKRLVLRGRAVFGGISVKN
jgi:predicted membrane protein